MVFKKRNRIVFFKIQVANCFLVLVCCVFFFSCTRLNTFEKNITIPNYQWKSDFVAKGSCSVPDTSLDYNTYIVLRHTDAFKYNNIWLNIGIQPPGDSMHFQKIDIPLGTDATGWFGSGMNDIWEVRQLLGIKFKKTGAYNFSITQIMRDDPLAAVMSIGFRVEKQ